MNRNPVDPTDHFAPELVTKWRDMVLPTITGRRNRDTPKKREMLAVSHQFHNADYIVPEPNQTDSRFESGAASSLIADAIETTARRAADARASIYCPAVPAHTAYQENLADQRASQRKRALLARWHSSQYSLKKSKLFRHLTAYATFCVGVIPDNTTGQAKIVIHSPLNAYPEFVESGEIRPVANIGFVYQRSGEEIAKQFAPTNPYITDHLNNNGTASDAPWDIAVWYDGEHTMVGLLGQHQESASAPHLWNNTFQEINDHRGSVLLSVTPNLTGKCNWVCPETMSLDGLYSAMTRILPAALALQKIAGLEYYAVKKAVVPDRYILAADNMTPRIVGGQWQPGASGQVNMLRGVKAVGELHSQPGAMTVALKSDLERISRLSSNNPSSLSGENAGSLRSGNTISQLSATSVDPQIREMHEVMETAMSYVNMMIADTEMAYYPTKKFLCITGMRGESSHVAYVPKDIWTETRESAVNYPIPGLDMFQTTQAIDGMMSSGMISEETARGMNPYVHDSETEGDLILFSQVRNMLLGVVEQQAAQGQFAPTDIIELMKHIKKGMPFELAFEEVQKAAQERQTTEAPPPGPDQLAAPETAPGVNPAGIGAEQPAPPPDPAAAGGAPTPDMAAMLAALGSSPQGAPA